MRQWIPHPEDIEPDEVHRDVSWGDGPAVALGMVVGIDGGVTIGGVSGPLGGEADRAAFRALRDAADVILVGSGTVKAENYGPPVARPEAAARRTKAGRAPVATIAVVTSTLSVPPEHRLFENPDHLPIVVTCASAPDAARAALEAKGVDVIVAGEEEVDLAAAVERLGSLGTGQILCEGGPELNRSLLRAGLVDQVFVTLAPVVTGSRRHLVADGLDKAVDLELVGVIQSGSELLLRYRVAQLTGQDS